MSRCKFQSDVCIAHLQDTGEKPRRNGQRSDIRLGATAQGFLAIARDQACPVGAACFLSNTSCLEEMDAHKAVYNGCIRCCSGPLQPQSLLTAKQTSSGLKPFEIRGLARQDHFKGETDSWCGRHCVCTGQGSRNPKAFNALKAVQAQAPNPNNPQLDHPEVLRFTLWRGHLEQA